VLHAACFGRVAVPVPDQPGFVANRLLFAYLKRAMQLLSWGVPPRDLEEATGFLGAWWQPLRRLDEIGLDTALRVGKYLVGPKWSHGGSFSSDWDLLVTWVSCGRLGRKSGEGFYQYPEGDREGIPADCLPSPTNPQLHPELERYLHTRRASRGAEPVWVVAALLLPLVAEVYHLWSRAKVADLGVIDALSVGGLLLPPETGGLVSWVKAWPVEAVRAAFSRVFELGWCTKEEIEAWELLRKGLEHL
jgi:hypothetical protein